MAHDKTITPRQAAAADARAMVRSWREWCWRAGRADQISAMARSMRHEADALADLTARGVAALEAA